MMLTVFAGRTSRSGCRRSMPSDECRLAVNARDIFECGVGVGVLVACDDGMMSEVEVEVRLSAITAGNCGTRASDMVLSTTPSLADRGWAYRPSLQMQ